TGESPRNRKLPITSQPDCGGSMRPHRQAQPSGVDLSSESHIVSARRRPVYLEAAAIAPNRKTPLFRSFDRKLQLTRRRMHRTKALWMVKGRARQAGLPEDTCCHSFRATGITNFLQNGGTVEKAQKIAAHESPRTTKLYDRTSDELTLDEIEKIRI